jgi:enterochelin esterase-like enzyme
LLLSSRADIEERKTNFMSDPSRPPSVEDRLSVIRDLVAAGRDQAADLGDRLTALLTELQREEIAAVWHGDVVFAVTSEHPAEVSVDGRPPTPMTAVAGTPYWVALDTIQAGRTHSYRYRNDEGEIAAGDVAGYNAGSYDRPDGRRGTMSSRLTIQSDVYPGAMTQLRVYANPGVDADRAAPVMVWHDGHGCVGAADLVGHRLQIVSDNLVERRLIPPMVHVLVSPSTPSEAVPWSRPGQTQASAMRSLQYDTVSDRYGRHIVDEILPRVQEIYKLRDDAYSRGAAGLSSGGISAFKLAWFHPEHFSRVHSTIGSFTALQWHPEQDLEGGYVFSHLVLTQERKNIRVWMSDGTNDIESGFGSWPLNNIQLANALKRRGYDFHFRFGGAAHNTAQGGLDLPESLAWLWRDYDPDRTVQSYEQEPEEAAQPPFRVTVANRDAW